MSLAILHLSDPHFGGEDALAADAAAEAARVAAPDLVVVTGDLTLNGKPREFRAAAAWLDRLPRPLVVTPGNHDTPYLNLPLRALRPFDRYRRFIGPPEGGTTVAGEIRARTINTARGAQPRPDWSKGAINLDLCRGAVADLDEGGANALKLVCCHHPLVEAVDAPVTGGVHRGEDAARILAEGRVDLILTGHVHNPFAVALPFADGLTHAVGAGTLSRRLRGAPPSFNEISVGADAITVCALGWDGRAFSPWRTWGLQRRV